jgi:hypothetical protein
LLRPDADVLFFAGEDPEVIAPALMRRFEGTYMVVRGRGHPVFPPDVKRVWRTETHRHWSTDPTKVAGFDAGTSAINLAMLFGATDIILLGYDMRGGRWFADLPGYTHPTPVIPEANHLRHLAPLPDLAVDAERLGVRIINCSPTTRVDCFERQPLERFL